MDKDFVRTVDHTFRALMSFEYSYSFGYLRRRYDTGNFSSAFDTYNALFETFNLSYFIFVCLSAFLYRVL